MINSEVILEIKDLEVAFHVRSGITHAVNGISYTLHKGETLGIVGESGCGKTVSSMALLKLISIPPGKIEKGSAIYQGKTDLIQLTNKQLRPFRGKEIAVIFQDPLTAFNQVMTIGDQMCEGYMTHFKATRKEALKEAERLMELTGIPSPAARLKDYPYQFSGGMRQRAMIAMGMSCEPKILLADEPTTALDVTISAQIFDLMNSLKRDYGTAIMMITHNMGVVAEMADEVAVMYMGNIVEYGRVEDVFANPTHPYTKALLRSIPVLGKGKNQQLEPIRGVTPDPFNRPKGCQCCPRCDYASARCETEMPGEEWVKEGHYTRCFNYREVMADGK